LGAVQVHDPFLKRVIVEAIKHLLQIVREKKIPIGFKDLGAGGIACAASELGVGGGMGVELHLEAVNVSDPTLLPEVIACSETQERFCLVVPRTFSKTVLEVFNKTFDLPSIYHKAGASVIGKVIPDPFFTLKYKGEQVGHLPIEAITTEIKADRYATPKTISKDVVEPAPTLEASDMRQVCEAVLRHPNNKSKWYVYRHFDHSVRGDTVIYPGEADAMLATPIQGCEAGVVVSMDSNLYGESDPYVAGSYAVAEGIRNVISVGGRPIALTDCLNYGNPEKPEVFYDFEEGVKGIADAANKLGFIPGEPLPVISGNVSFYNESKKGSAVVPSPVIVVVGKMDSYKTAITMAFKKEDSAVILVGKRYEEFGGTQVSVTKKGLNRVAPQVRFEAEATANKAIYQMIHNKTILSCHDIAMGGVWISALEMMLGQNGRPTIGVSLNFSKDDNLLCQLFSENGGYLIEVDSENVESCLNIFKNKSVFAHVIGKTSPKTDYQIAVEDHSVCKWTLPELVALWEPYVLTK